MTGPEYARLAAFARDCVQNGDMTPCAERMMLRILSDMEKPATVKLDTLHEIHRIVVVDQDGAHEYWADRWEIHHQDGGKTLKLIQNGYGAAHQAVRYVELAKQLALLRGLQ